MTENNPAQKEENIGKKVLKVFLLFLAIIILANLIVLDFWWFVQAGREESLEIASNQAQGLKIIQPEGNNKLPTLDSCGSACQETIEEKIREQLSQNPLMATYTPTTFVSKENAGAKVFYIPLVSSGSVASMDWTDVSPSSEFYFNPKDYPGAKEFRFMAYLLSINNDLGMARLYDHTQKRWVYFSDVQTKNSSFTFVESKPLEILPGNNRYTIQLRSVNATQVQIKDAKIKIVF